MKFTYRVNHNGKLYEAGQDVPIETEGKKEVKTPEIAVETESKEEAPAPKRRGRRKG